MERLTMKSLSLLATLALSLLLATVQAAPPALLVRDAWIPEAPPVAKVQAGYMALVNEGANPVTVVGATSAEFDAVEMHRTVEVEGTMRMEAQPSLRVEPGATLQLAPGGLHLMLIGPKRPLVAGDRVGIDLRLEGGSVILATAEVRQAEAGGEQAHHHHH
jgi:copper(I)-binding protein